VDIAIVERRASQELPGSRAGGLHSRTIEVSRSAWNRRSVLSRKGQVAQVAQFAQFASVPLDISDFPTPGVAGAALVELVQTDAATVAPRTC
jgi:3-(3-hydroxy-phenyl)propionate hydroxylase